MRKSRTRALFGVLALIAATLLSVTGTASAGTGAVLCADGSLTMSADGTAVGTGTLTGCVDPLNLALHSATVQMSGLTTVKLDGAEVDTTTTDTIHWNTGAVSRVTEERTFTNVGPTTTEAGAGAVVEGLLMPSVEAETGEGTHSTSGSHEVFTIHRGPSTFDANDGI